MATTAEKVTDKVTKIVNTATVVQTEPGLSAEAHKVFYKHSRPGEDGTLYMDQDQFINAIAPPDEDFVSSMPDYKLNCG
jgi:hypothetical protein